MYHTQITSIQQARGFSLIELLVSFLISAVVLLGTLNLFIANKLSYNLQQSIASVQEEGRYAVQALSKGFMHAGYSEDNTLTSVVRVENTTTPDTLNVTRTQVDANGAAASGQQYSKNGTGDGKLFDQIIIRIAGGDDCTGEDSNWPTATINEQWKFYYVNSDRQLVCADSLGNVEPITEQVESFQIQYGIDTDDLNDPDFLNADSYVNLPLPDHRVVSIRYAVMVKSRDVVAKDQEYLLTYGIQMLDEFVRQGTGAGRVDYSDGHLRRMFFSTVQLRNIGTSFL